MKACLLAMALFCAPALWARQAVQQLDSLLLQQPGGYGYSVLVADGDGVLFEKSYGSRDSLGKPVNKRTLFNVASVSKSFTALGIMMLAAQHKLKLSDSIGTYFDKVPADKQSITISQLLSHQSGFQQNYVCDGIRNGEEALKALLADTLGAAPGTGFDYSNQNFEMLALIIEKVGNTTYEQFIRQQILKPLKMKDTFFWDEVSKNKNVAEGKRVLEDSIKQKNWGYIGSGGIYTTPTDLYKFAKAVIENRLIPASSTALMFSSYYTTSSQLGIGYGWYISNNTPWNTKEIWTRGSEDWGHNAVIRWFPDKQRMIIVCTNSGELDNNRHAAGNRLVSDSIANYWWKRP